MKKSLLIFIILFIFTICNQNIYSDGKNEVSDAYKKSYEYELKGLYKDAIVSINWLKDKHNSFYLNLRLGWLYYCMGKYETSASYYIKAVKVEEYSVKARIGLVNSYLALGNYTKAKQESLKTVKYAPSEYYALSSIAYCEYVQKQYTKAIEAYEKVLQYYPYDTEMLSGLGWSYLFMGNQKKAKDIFEMILSISPEHNGALSGLKEITK